MAWFGTPVAHTTIQQQLRQPRKRSESLQHYSQPYIRLSGVKNAGTALRSRWMKHGAAFAPNSPIRDAYSIEVPSCFRHQVDGGELSQTVFACSICTKTLWDGFFCRTGDPRITRCIFGRGVRKGGVRMAQAI